MMVVEACAKPEMSDSDDEPLVFKRSVISKQNEQRNEGKQLLRQNAPMAKRRPGVHSNSNGQVSNIQSWNPEGHEASKPIGETSQSNLQLLKSNEASVVDASISRSILCKTKVVDKNKSFENPFTQSNKDSDDSEDEKPLSVRLGSRQPRGNSCLQIKEPQCSMKKESDDSDDEIPLSKKYKNPSGSISATKSNEKKDINHISSHRNGSIKKDGQHKSLTPLKRSLNDVSSSGHSAVKRTKPMIGSEMVISKNKSGKAEKGDDNDHVPIAQRTKLVAKHEEKSSLPKKVTSSSFKKSITQSNKKVTQKSKYLQSLKMRPRSGDGKKWSTLVHNGVIFPPPYQPHGIKMLYKGKPVYLTPEQEEVATMYAVMKDTEYAQKKQFNENFTTDWRKILGKKHVIQKLEFCDFGPIYDWYQKEKEKKKLMTPEEKKSAKEEKLKQEEKYMWAVVDGVKEKVGNFRVEPSGLFRGRGDHPKMGKRKRRIKPSDITINIGKGAPIPECPIPGERSGYLFCFS